MKAQLTELLTQYGDVGAIWFDGIWDQDENPGFDWRLGDSTGCTRIAPEACHQQPPSRAVRRRRRAGVRTRPAGREHGRIFGAGDQPPAARNVSDDERHVGIQDHRPKLQIAQTLVRYLAGAAGRGANLLLNIVPSPTARCPRRLSNGSTVWDAGCARTAKPSTARRQDP